MWRSCLTTTITARYRALLDRLHIEDVQHLRVRLEKLGHRVPIRRSSSSGVGMVGSSPVRDLNASSSANFAAGARTSSSTSSASSTPHVDASPNRFAPSASRIPSTEEEMHGAR